MKTLCTLIAALLLAGCSQPKDRAEITALKSELAVLREDHTKLRKEFNDQVNLIIGLLDELKKGIDAAGEFGASGGRLQVRLNTEFSERISALEARTNYVVVTGMNTVGVAPVSRTAMKPKPGSALQQGIPREVFERINTAAARDWPNDFTMQEFEIKQQVAAWKKLNP